eukprot:3493662-Pyramimonas_sp.AAC.1
MQQWEKDSDRPHWWACPGRSCDRAVWQQQARSEWIAMVGDLQPDQDWASASILLDLWKAFEQVRVSALAGQAAGLALSRTQGAPPGRLLLAGFGGFPDSPGWRRVRHR